MSDVPGPRDARELLVALRAVPGLAQGALRLTALPGGVTNHNYLVTVGDSTDRFVARIPGRDAHLLGIDREVELAATMGAAGVGVGPEVVAFLRPEGILVTRYIEGQQLSQQALHEAAVLKRVAASLSRVHDGGAFAGSFDALAVVASYLELARTGKVHIPRQQREAASVARRIVATGLPARAVRRPCHNDLLASNLIDDGSTIRIVDWEYAGMGDPLFDLGNLSVNHELTPEQDAIILAAYDGAAATPERLAGLTLMRLLSDYREAMWGVVQQGISELTVDFVAYAQTHFDRMLANAATPAFEEALRLVTRKARQ